MTSYKGLYHEALSRLEDLNKKIADFQETQQAWDTQKNKLQEELEDSKHLFQQQLDSNKKQFQQAQENWESQKNQLQKALENNENKFQQKLKNDEKQFQQTQKGWKNKHNQFQQELEDNEKQFQQTQKDWNNKHNQFQQELKGNEKKFQQTQKDWESQKTQLQQELEDSKNQFQQELENKLQQASQDLGDKEKEIDTFFGKMNDFYEGEEIGEIMEDGKKKRTGGMRGKVSLLQKEFEELVADRTKEALAKIFEEQAEKHKKRSDVATLWFNSSIIGLVGLLLVIISVFVFTELTFNLSLYPLFSIVTFASGYLLFRLNKTISEETRLFTEYTHKHSLAKAYTGYKKEAEGNEDLRQKLLSDLTDAIAQNPVRLLSIIHSKEKNPHQEFVDGIKKTAKSAKRQVKIPGMDSD